MNGNNRVNGQSCPDCAETGFNTNLPASLYLLKYEFLQFPIEKKLKNLILRLLMKHLNYPFIAYKVGITNRDVEIRVRQLESSVNKVYPNTEIEIIDQMEFDSGRDAKDRENSFKEMDEIKIIPQNGFDGKTEMFGEKVKREWNKQKSLHGAK